MTYTQDPREAWDYAVDWTDVFGDDPVETSTWNVDPSLVKSGEGIEGMFTNAVISAADGAVVGKSYRVENVAGSVGGRSGVHFFWVRLIKGV